MRLVPSDHQQTNRTGESWQVAVPVQEESEQRMKTYIGTKIIQAEPQDEGYKVVYKDGYTSWSPKAAFEEAYVCVDDIPNKLSIDDLKAKIKHIDYYRIVQTTTTVCTLILENGFTVIGKSACIDRANFNVAFGEQIALEDALDKVWELEGYLLAQRRYEAGL